MGFMTSLAGLHGGLTLQQMHEQQSKRQRFVSSLDEQVKEKAARKERERLEFERQEQRDARLYGSHWTANQRDKSQPAQPTQQLLLCCPPPQLPSGMPPQASCCQHRRLTSWTNCCKTFWAAARLKLRLERVGTTACQTNVSNNPRVHI